MAFGHDFQPNEGKTQLIEVKLVQDELFLAVIAGKLKFSVLKSILFLCSLCFYSHTDLR